MTEAEHDRAWEEAALMFWLQRAHQGLRGEVLRAFHARGYDITTDHWTVLHCLWRGREGTAAEIATETGRDRAMVNRLLDGLEEIGVVTREAAGRRGRVVRLTNKGRVMQTAIGHIFLELVRRLPPEVPASDLAAARRVLQAMAHAFGDAGGGFSSPAPDDSLPD